MGPPLGQEFPPIPGEQGRPSPSPELSCAEKNSQKREFWCFFWGQESIPGRLKLLEWILYSFVSCPRSELRFGISWRMGSCPCTSMPCGELPDGKSSFHFLSSLLFPYSLDFQGPKGEQGPPGIPGPQGLPGVKGDKVTALGTARWLLGDSALSWAHPTSPFFPGFSRENRPQRQRCEYRG